VRAAGGLVWRPAGDGEGWEVLVVHRPKYDDWSLPKGKADEGESDEDCAVREVEEETGLRCTIERQLGSSEYVDRHGLPKVVQWFVMYPDEGETSPRLAAPGGEGQTIDGLPEVDEVRWVDSVSADELLSYELDRDLVAGFTPPAG
jgi:8-oxo-dGTP diphosphatase